MKSPAKNIDSRIVLNQALRRHCTIVQLRSRSLCDADEGPLPSRNCWFPLE
jgi:hypothetical protein